MITELKNVLLDDFWIMPQTPKYTGSGIPYVTSKNIKGGKINFENVNYISIDDYKKISKNRPILKNDILISMIGTLGETAIVDDSYGEFYGQNMFLVRLDNSKIDYRYFINFFKSTHVKNHLARKQNKSTQSYLKANHIESLMIPVFTIKEQKEIANQLDKVQDLIKLKTQQIEKLDELIKSQFVEMFESKDYNKTTIEKCAKFQGGYAFKSKDFVENGVKLVQISNVNKDTLDWIEINRVPESFIERYKEYSLVANDVVMAMTRPIIKSLNEVKIAQVREDDLPCLLNQRVGRFIINDSVNKEYLIYCCKSDKFKNYVEKMSGNSLQPNISSKQVENFEISLPPIELQNKFAEFVKQIDKQKFEIKKSLDEIQEIYESLMDKYFG